MATQVHTSLNPGFNASPRKIMKEDTLQSLGDSAPLSLSDIRSESLFSIKDIEVTNLEYAKKLLKKQLPLTQASINQTQASSKPTNSRTGMIAFVYLFLFALGIVLVLILDSNMASADKPLKIAEESPTNYTTPSQVANTINITTYSTSTTTEDSQCVNWAWINDGFCDDDSNTLNCDYDGGDCCLDKVEGPCFDCTCHLDGKRHLTEMPEDDYGYYDYETLFLLVGGIFSSLTHAIDPSTNEFFVLPPYPHPCNTPVGYFTNHSIIVCGGRDCGFDLSHPLTTLSTKCYRLEGNSWIPLDFQMSSIKYHPASININDKLWVFGGGNGFTYPTTTTEYLDLKKQDGFLPGPDLPIGLVSHCVTQLSATSIIIIGGFTPHGLSFPHGLDTTVLKNTFVFDFDSNQWSTGPSNLYRRGAPGCAIFRMDDEYAVIAAGGYSPDTTTFMNSTEVLLPKSGGDEKKWELGPELPAKIEAPTMVTNHITNQVYLIGGNLQGLNYNSATSTIYKLVQPSEGIGFQWSEMPYALTQPRSHFLAIKAPAEYLRKHNVPLYLK